MVCGPTLLSENIYDLYWPGGGDLPDVKRQGEGTDLHKDTIVLKETLHANSSHFLLP